MRDTDRRSWAVALVPDRLLNAHLTPDSPTLGAVCDRLDALGFGLIQLPPGGLDAASEARAVELALDQAQDYAATGYRVVWLRYTLEDAERALADRVAAELVRRTLELAATIDIAPGGVSLESLSERLTGIALTRAAGSS